MNAIRIRKTLDSDTLHLPELKPLIGRTVDIIVQEPATPATAEEFYTEAGHIPETEGEWSDQQARFRAWRAGPRFEPFWGVLDRLLARDFDSTRRWAAAARAAQDLRDTGYDFDAWREQREFDQKHADDHLP